MIVLDSTVLVSDPLLVSTAWKILAHASREGSARLCMTEVVFLEAVAGFKRRMSEAITGIERWESKHAGPLGLHQVAERLRRELSDHASSYEGLLRNRLEDVPVQVIEIPAIAHRVLVERAARRLPPCDQSGDGYRDTLNWLILIDLAVKRSEEDVILWVSDDRDFRAPDGRDLHPILQDELGERNLSARVLLIASLNEAALKVAIRSTEASGDELKEIEARLTQDSLTAYVRENLLSDPTSFVVSAVELALPIGTHSPIIADVGEFAQISFEARAALDDEAAAIEIAFLSEATILLESTIESGLSDDVLEISKGGHHVTSQTEKLLRFTALLAVDRYNRPIGGEIVSIRAPEDDPGHDAWRAAARWTRSTSSLLPRDALESLVRSVLPRDALESLARSVQAAVLPRDALESLARGALGAFVPRDAIESLERTALGTFPLRDALERGDTSADSGTSDTTLGDEPGKAVG